MEPSRITRFGAPNKYDHVPKGTQCAVVNNSIEIEYWIQTNENEDEPVWVLE